MAMIKTVSADGWDFGEPAAALLKYSSRGLVGADRAAFVKRAGADNVFLPFLDAVKFAADEEPVHLISHGATEYWGPNRNGDGFKEATCRLYCHTFEKLARFYRSHLNKDPAKSYGVVKKAAYNEAMHRVELLVGLNKTAAAAARNGGLVADRELQKLAAGKDLAVSMACRVSHDECSFCKNAARTREEYCTAATCKAGGCRDNLTRLVKVGGDVHHLHVDNPHPAWFDISDVLRPADPTAYAHRADWLTKAAADAGYDGDFAGGDRGLTAPLGVLLFQADLPFWDPDLRARIKLAYGLDALERRGDLGLPAATRRAFTAAAQGEAELPVVDGEVKLAEALAACADCKIVFGLRDFARFTKRAALAAAAGAALPGVYGRMADDGVLEARLAADAWLPVDARAGLRYQAAAAALAPSHALDKTAVDRRCLLSAVREPALDLDAAPAVKQAAAVTVEAEALCRDYACYKVAALHRIAAADPCFLLTARYAATQNQVI